MLSSASPDAEPPSGAVASPRELAPAAEVFVAGLSPFVPMIAGPLVALAAASGKAAGASWGNATLGAPAAHWFPNTSAN